EQTLVEVQGLGLIAVDDVDAHRMVIEQPRRDQHDAELAVPIQPERALGLEADALIIVVAELLQKTRYLRRGLPVAARQFLGLVDHRLEVERRSPGRQWQQAQQGIHQALQIHRHSAISTGGEQWRSLRNGTEYLVSPGVKTVPPNDHAATDSPSIPSVAAPTASHTATPYCRAAGAHRRRAGAGHASRGFLSAPAAGFLPEFHQTGRGRRGKSC